MQRNITYLVSALSLALCAQETRAQGTIPERNAVIERTLLESLSLADGRQLVTTRDGCHVLADAVPGDRAPIKLSDLQWSGPCPFGIADGEGKLVAGESGKVEATFLYMGMIDPFDTVGKTGRISKTNRAHGLATVRLKDVDANFATGDAGAGGNWFGEVELSNGLDRSAEVLARRAIDCKDLATVPLTDWVQDTKQAIENLKDANKGCKKYLEKQQAAGVPMRKLRVIESVQTNAAGLVTTRLYPCSFDLDLAEELKRDNAYCTNYWISLAASLKPKVDEKLALSRQEKEAIIAEARSIRTSVPAKYQAIIQKEDAAEKQRLKARGVALNADIAARQSAFIASPEVIAKLPTAAKAPAPFAKPVNSNKTGVLLINEVGGPFALRFDPETLELGSKLPAERLSPSATPEEFAQSIDRIRRGGANLLYIIDLGRSAYVQPLADLTVNYRNIEIGRTQVDNPAYREIDSALQAVRVEEAQAQLAVQQTGKKTAKAAPSPADQLAAIQARRLTLEKQLQGIERQLLKITNLKFPYARARQRSIFEARLGVFACSLDTGMCSEKEKVLAEETSAIYPIFALKNDAELPKLVAENQKLRSDLHPGLDAKIYFGFPADEIGNFMAGAVQQLPLAALQSYLALADEEFREKFAGRYREDLSASPDLLERIRGLRKELEDQRASFEDVSGILSMPADTFTATSVPRPVMARPTVSVPPQGLPAAQPSAAAAPAPKPAPKPAKAGGLQGLEE